MQIAFQQTHNKSFSRFSKHFSGELSAHSTLIDENCDLSPLNNVTLDPFSPDYQDMVIDAFHLHDNCNLDQMQKTELDSLMRKYAQVFMLPGASFYSVRDVEHTIDTSDAKPQYSTPYSYSPAQLQLIKKEIKKMLEQNILEHSTSPWGDPCLLVKKKTEHGLHVTP